MDGKACTKCGVVYSLDHFNKKGSGRSTRCKKCVAEYYRNYYHSNPERKQYLIARNKANSALDWEEAKKLVLSAFESGCVDCGETDIRVLEFDHKGDKEFNVSSLMRMNSLEKLKNEIAKCEVVCANHHRIRTAKQFGTWRHGHVYPLADNESKG